MESTTLTYDRVASYLSARGIDIRKVFTHPVDVKKGLACYVCSVQIGQIRKLNFVPISQAKDHRDRLIGFLYEGPALRTDSEIMAKLSTGDVVLPRFVLMYRPHIPMNERNGLASGESRIRERPMVTLDTRLTQHAG